MYSGASLIRTGHLCSQADYSIFRISESLCITVYVVMKVNWFPNMCPDELIFGVSEVPLYMLLIYNNMITIHMFFFLNT